MTESDAVRRLKEIADQLDALNAKLEEENRRLKEAIILLSDAVAAILPVVTADEAAIGRARAANEAARRLINNPPS